MEEEEESEDSQELLTKLSLNEDTKKSPIKLAEHLSRFKVITKDMVLQILAKNSKTRTDVDNRIIADYLSKNYEYFQKIKEESQKRFLKLINVLRFESYLPNELILNVNYEEDRFFIVFDGSVFVYRLSIYEKEMKLGEFCNYLAHIKQKDEKQYVRILYRNKHFGINFEEIQENPYYHLFKIKTFIFNIEEMEEIGQFSNGYVFGEMNLIRKKKKDIIVKTVTRTQVISVSKFDFNRILRTIEEKRLELLSERFKQKFTMFKFWSMEQLITLFNYCSYAVFHKDDYIYRQNEPSQYIYFIEKGKFEQYCNTSYSWYKNYIEYIGNLNDNLINLIMAKSPENLRKLRELYDGELEDHEKKDKLISKNNDKNLFFLNMKDIHLEKKKSDDRYIKTDNLFSIKKEEDELNNPNKLVKIPILTSEVPRVIGLEEPFEFKRRFTTVKCLSGKIVAKKISVYDLLKLLFIYREFNYDNECLNLLIQRKVVLVDTIKNHLKKNAIKFEKDIESKYNELIYQKEDLNKRVAGTKFKGWNNGLFLDNILDTSLHLFKPKPEKLIKKEKEHRFNLVNNILRQLPDKNRKKTNRTIFLSASKQENKDPFLLTERNKPLSPNFHPEKMKKKIRSVKNAIDTYYKKKFGNQNSESIIKKKEDISDYIDIESKIRKPSTLMNKKTLISNINSVTKRLTMTKYMTPIKYIGLISPNNQKNNLYLGLKISKIKNKKKNRVKSIDNSFGFFSSQTINNNSIMDSFKKDNKNKRTKENTISNITNRVDSFSNNKISLVINKGEKYFPTIINNTYKIKVNEGMKKLFIISKKK